jgi:hypothetical protein
MSITIRKLVQKPGSPDIAIKQATIEESVFARIAHVNRLSKDVYDIVYQDHDLSESNVVRIKSKKGIINFTGGIVGSTIPVYLQNSEIINDPSKFYLQLSVKTDNSAAVIPIQRTNDADPDTLKIDLVVIDGVATTPCILYYELVKIE